MTKKKKILRVQCVFLLSSCVFIGSFLHTTMLTDVFLMYHLMLVAPLVAVVGTAALCKMKMAGFYLIYLPFLSFLHHFLWVDLLGGMQIVWLLAWVIVPSLTTWGFVMTTWEVKVRERILIIEEAQIDFEEGWEEEVNEYRELEEFAL